MVEGSERNVFQPPTQNKYVWRMMVTSQDDVAAILLDGQKDGGGG